MARIICIALCAGFFKVLNERWEGKTFAFFSSFSVSSFVSVYLINQLKYPENYVERLRIRQVNCSGALSRAKRARSGAPWVRKFGKLSNQENLVMT